MFCVTGLPACSPSHQDLRGMAGVRTATLPVRPPTLLGSVGRGYVETEGRNNFLREARWSRIFSLSRFVFGCRLERLRGIAAESGGNMSFGGYRCLSYRRRARTRGCPCAPFGGL